MHRENGTRIDATGPNGIVGRLDLPEDASSRLNEALAKRNELLAELGDNLSKKILEQFGTLDIAALSTGLAAIFTRTFNADAVLAGLSKPLVALRERLHAEWQKIAGQFAELAQALIEYDRLCGKVSTILASRGWIVIPLVSIDLLQQVEQVAETHPSEVDRLLVEFYRSKVPAYATELLEYEPCKPWAQKIQHAFEAHMEEKYDLAVPMWLIIIDGVARAIAKDSGFRLYKSVGKLGSYKKKISKVTPNGTSVFGDRDREALVQVLFLMSRGTKHHRPEQGTNRNTIIHGLDPNFGTERESIQCLNTLLMFCILSGR